MATPIIMCGAAGRMGLTILRCAAEDPEFEIVGGVEAEGSAAVGRRVGDLIGRPEINAPIVGDFVGLAPPDNAVVVDFSLPEGLVPQIRWSAEQGLSSVIGTTGLGESERAEIERASREIPVVFAPNMSVGVNTLFKITADVARILGESYDVEIAEMHHRYKKDAPSGTARRLGEIAAEAMGGTYEELVRDGRSGITGERPARQIGMHALRGGDVVGEHTVTFAALGERIELTHRAQSRETFARGALRAAAWVAGREPGLYDMQDVLGIGRKERR
ncbi:MAG TPA: 4-hydroxy-tetrahydrodipicolinate reductase [Sumerlaeia bacterium]|nr:4-hydroxy-tetrahydrodipicolinate reductase [Sumerlaeia bacterium]